MSVDNVNGKAESSSTLDRYLGSDPSKDRAPAKVKRIGEIISTSRSNSAPQSLDGRASLIPAVEDVLGDDEEIKGMLANESPVWDQFSILDTNTSEVNESDYALELGRAGSSDASANVFRETSTTASGYQSFLPFILPLVMRVSNYLFPDKDKTTFVDKEILLAVDSTELIKKKFGKKN